MANNNELLRQALSMLDRTTTFRYVARSLTRLSADKASHPPALVAQQALARGQSSSPV